MLNSYLDVSGFSLGGVSGAFGLLYVGYERVCFDVVGEQQEKRGSGMNSQILGKWAPDPPTPTSGNLAPDRPGTPFFKFLVSVS